MQALRDCYSNLYGRFAPAIEVDSVGAEYHQCKAPGNILLVKRMTGPSRRFWRVCILHPQWQDPNPFAIGFGKLQLLVAGIL